MHHNKLLSVMMMKKIRVCGALQPILDVRSCRGSYGAIHCINRSMGDHCQGGHCQRLHQRVPLPQVGMRCVFVYMC